MLAFDKPTHTYRYGGRLVPGVTSLLDGLHNFAGISREILDSAKERGTFVHDMCVAVDDGSLDERALAEMDVCAETGESVWLPYLRAYRQFLSDRRPAWTAVEKPGYSGAYGFAGTPDRLGRLVSGGGGRCVIDIKTGPQPHPCWGLQTAAYRQIASEEYPGEGWPLASRYTLQLLPSGKYRLIPWNLPTDWFAFHGLLQVHYWRTHHGI